MANHAGTKLAKGQLHRGTAPKPSPVHGGSGAPKGQTHAPRPRVYGVHGGTSLQQGVLKRK